MRVPQKLVRPKSRGKVVKSEKESVSVAIEEVKPEDWAEKVYKPYIVNNQEKLYRKPGYTM